jgi:hypothetical protein
VNPLANVGYIMLGDFCKQFLIGPANLLIDAGLMKKVFAFLKKYANRGHKKLTRISKE